MPYKDVEKARERNRAYQKKWYLKNKEKHIARNHAIEKSKREYVLNIKKNGKCIKCGFDNYKCLEFHHRNKESKIDSITQAIQGNWALSRIIEEIEKCDLLCANCHRILHWEERELAKDQL